MNFLFVVCVQFQSFSQYRSKLLKKGEDEVATLRANTKVFNKGMTMRRITTVRIIIEELLRAKHTRQSTMGEKMW